MKRLTVILPVVGAASLAWLFACWTPTVGDALRALDAPAYTQTVETSDFRVELKYLPRVRRLLNSTALDSGKGLGEDVLDSLRTQASEIRGMAFFLTIGPRDRADGIDLSRDLIYSGKSGHANSGEAFMDYSMGMGGKIWIEAEGRTHTMSTYQMENNWGYNPKRSFLLLFPDINEKHPDCRLEVVLDELVPGLGRKKFQWALPVGKYDELI